MLHPFTSNDVSGTEAYPFFFKSILLQTAAFSILFHLVPYVLAKKWPEWYNGLDPIKRKEIPTYLISFIHHFIVVPVGWIHIYQDFMLFRSGTIPNNDHYALKEAIWVPLGCSFLFADIINSAVKEAIAGRPLYLLHHVATMTLGMIILR